MSWREFAASLVSSLAWPASLATIAWLLRRQLAALLDGPIKRWKAGPVEIEYWTEETAEVAGSVDVLDAVGASRAEPADDELARLSELAERTPVLAVIEGYRLVEREVRRIGMDGNIEGAEDAPLSKLLPAEVDAGLLTPETLNAVRGLTALRNLAAHGPAAEATTTVERAREYVILVQAVLFALSRPPRRASRDGALAQPVA
jgi:hypothetical protein